MNSIQLEYVLTVAQTGSFTEAARRIYISQPALSKQIRLLEEELGAVLLIRRPHGVRLTPEGRKLLIRAGEISRIMKDIPSEIRESRHGVSGELNIACGPFLSRRILPDLLKRLLERFPGIGPKIREANSEEQAEMLLNGAADIGIGTVYHRHQHLAYHPIFRSSLVLIRSVHSDLAAKKKVSRREIAGHRLVTYPPGTALYDAVCRSLSPCVPENIFMDSQSSSTIIELVRENFGIALVPDYLIEPEKRGGLVVGGFESGEEVTIGFQYSPERGLTPQAEALVGVFREKFSPPPPVI